MAQWARCRQQDLRRRHPGQREVPRLRACAVGRLAGGLDPSKSLQAREFMMLGQRLARYDSRRPGFGAPVAVILAYRAGERVWLRPEAGPGIGQERVLVGLEREAPVAATRVDRCNRTAIAVARHRRSRLFP